MPQHSLNLRVGQFELELPFTQARSIWISPYDIYTQANIGAMNSLIPLQQFVNNQFTMADAGKGIELSGGCTPAAISTQSPSSTRTPVESGRTQIPAVRMFRKRREATMAVWV